MIQKRNLNATEDNSVAPELEREALTRLRSGNGIYCTSTTFEEFNFCCKKLSFHLAQDVGEGARVVKTGPCGCREELLRGHWAPEAPGCARGGGRACRGPAQPGDQTACGGRSGAAHLPEELPVLTRNVALREVAQAGVGPGRTQGTQAQKGLVQALLRESGSFHSVLGFPPLAGRGFRPSWKRARPPGWLWCYLRNCRSV